MSTFSDTDVKRLIAQAMAPLQKRIAELEAEVARLKKNSSNSSKPPSSDITKPPESSGASRGGGPGKKRHIGGQPGHEKHRRAEFPPDQVDHIKWYELAHPGALVPLNQWRKVQQVELAPKLFHVTEHRARRYHDPATGQIHTAPLPPEIAAAGLCGPRFSALVGYLKGHCRMSYRLIQDFCGEVMALAISMGQLVRVVQKNSAALAEVYPQLLAALPRRKVLGVDETGHYDRGDLMWTWCFRAQDFAVFRITASRGSDVLKETLGADYAGTLVCDFFSPYRKFLQQTPCAMQFCQAHLIRDIRFLETLSHRAGVRWAGKLLQLIKTLFRKHHQRLADAARDFSPALDRIRRKILALVARAPASCEAQNIRERFRQYKEQYFTFVASPQIAPTNNFTEQTLRFAVIDRKLTQGTRGQAGQIWCQRIWSVLATCRIQKRSVFQFLTQSLACSFKHIAPPQLLPAATGIV
jgi:transposase